MTIHDATEYLQIAEQYLKEYDTARDFSFPCVTVPADDLRELCLAYLQLRKLGDVYARNLP